MMDITHKIQQRYEAPLSEERVWMADYGQYSTHKDVTPDDIEAVVEEHAEKIEASMNVVTDVIRDNRPGFGMDDEAVVALVVILGRSANREMMDKALEGVDYQIRDAVVRDEQ